MYQKNYFKDKKINTENDSNSNSVKSGSPILWLRQRSNNKNEQIKLLPTGFKFDKGAHIQTQIADKETSTESTNNMNFIIDNNEIEKGESKLVENENDISYLEINKFEDEEDKYIIRKKTSSFSTSEKSIQNTNTDEEDIILFTPLTSDWKIGETICILNPPSKDSNNNIMTIYKGFNIKTGNTSIIKQSFYNPDIEEKVKVNL
jgi:hypothetical protein